ncbi:MAG: PTS sugar transporter subunit IIA [Actinomycetales bacterium]|nr:PTS sugar transporter subunit IIA [Actinomycetales bacterium]
MRFAALADALAEGAIEVGARASDRTEAIRIAGDLLVSTGRATPHYTDEMVRAVDEHGPYIVIAPGIALAHGRPSAEVLDTGLSLAVLADPVVFGHSTNDPVRLVFGLAAFDHNAHLGLMRELALALSDVSVVNSLLNASQIEEVRAAL